ncbi:hypothetical protein EJ05DRAFT_123929 [Pseudovirgaria hyperparasitica]|uniref:Tim17-domain-containing protein n=1 Tax=Pseudovirgaria hyperparasitica TaxID=470096 RepID=A0A6A6VX21_9PEZI|nr:uncharacterized protein EJ05DRAFT_123929 [Pseudovirgaria hyperparasitica]KAF2755142.1 hypothetical protein EJ05DRAFT_123929 [Pseudovirgaria hyperparasitica]
MSDVNRPQNSTATTSNSLVSALARREAAFKASDLSSKPSGHERLSIPFETRIILGTCVSFGTGASLGLLDGSHMAGLVFRAENAHRLPTTHTGWYFYHKSKNYAMMMGGLKAGVRGGVLVGAFGGAFMLLEEAGDWIRGTRDFANSAFAGTVIATGYAGIKDLPRMTALRTARMGFVVGAGYGVLQDALSLARGRRVGWIDFLTGRRGDRIDEDDAY